MTISDLIKQRVSTIMKANGMLETTDAVDYIINNEKELSTVKEFAHFSGFNVTKDQLLTELRNYNIIVSRKKSIEEGIFTNNETPDNPFVIDIEDNNKCAGVYFNKLRDGGKLGENDFIRVVDECNIITQEFLPQPAQPCNRFGLVVGQVQSGKTTIFNGIISSAADMGFNIIVILSGTIESLRRQTQSRIVKDVTDPWSQQANRPFYFTWISKHQEGGLVAAGNANQVLTEIGATLHRQVAVGVFLKNINVLQNVRNFLATINPLQHKNIRALIIDDEADQATPNGGVSRDEVTPINEAIKALVIREPRLPDCPTQGKTCYLGFTATPFANLLNEAGSLTLYPKDFLYFLRSSKRYFGPMQLFGNPAETEEEETIIPLNVIRILNQDDIEGTVPPAGRNAVYSPQIMEGLKNSIIWYILATAARRVNDIDCWSTMLIHTSSRIEHHRGLANIIEVFLTEAQNNWKARISELENFWYTETNKVNVNDFKRAFPDYGGDGPTILPEWADVLNQIPSVLEDIKIKIDNSQSALHERIDFDDDLPPTHKLQIAVGGNTLSRGLTLEGLVSSYFARRFTSRSAYDTLLQMGRWFGFRMGYELLPRIWTTDYLRDRFRELVIMEQNLRSNLELYLRGDSPAEKAPVITRMPAMAITRKTVLGNTNVVEADYSGSAPQTIFFLNRHDWLNNNVVVAKTMLDNILNYFKPQQNMDNRLIYEGVPNQIVIDFLEKFNFHQSSNTFNKRHLLNFILNNDNKYNQWNVVVMGGRSKNKFQIRESKTVFKNLRTRLKSDPDPIINIKSLRSTADLLCDRHDLLPKSFKERDLWKIRENHSLPPVLVLFPIDKDSKYSGSPDDSFRMSLNAAEDIIGVSMIMYPPEPGAGAIGVSIDLTETY